MTAQAWFVAGSPIAVLKGKTMTSVSVSCHSSAEPAARPLRRDAARNRGLLLAAATEVFARDGLAATLDDIARHAGVGVGTAYRHFANKQVLIDSLVMEQMDRVTGFAVAAAATIDDPWSAFETFVRQSVELQAANRSLREVMAADQGAAHAHARQRLAPAIEALVCAAQASGQMRPDIVVTDVPAVFWMLGAVVDQTHDVAPELWQRYLNLLLAGMRAGSDWLEPAALTEIELQLSMQSGRTRR